MRFFVAGVTEPREPDKTPDRSASVAIAGSTVTTRAERKDVSDSQLISVTDPADAAFNAFDFSAHAGKGIRVYLAGFG